MQVIRLRRLMTARTTRAPFRSWMFSAGVLLAVSTAALAADAAALRRVIPLDGTWQVEQGKMASAPAEFSHTLVVPGLVDMARPAFAEVGVHSRLREAFWYRRTFRIDGPLPALAVLKVHKAMFGFRVILNGTPLGDHVGSFTPGMFDARAALRPARTRSSSAWALFGHRWRSPFPPAGTSKSPCTSPESTTPSNWSFAARPTSSACRP